MIVLKANISTIYVDVDDTMVMWPELPHVPQEGYEEFRCPLTNAAFYGKPNWDMVDRVVRHKKFGGATIVVWSQSGWEWAEAIVKHLKMEDSVDLVASKPDIYYDDIPAKEQSWQWRLPVVKKGGE